MKDTSERARGEGGADKSEQGKSFILLLLVIMACVLVAFYGWTFWRSPMMGEDFAFPPDYGTTGLHDRLTWIVHKIHSHSRDWNARLGEQLAIIWLSLPSWVFTLVSVLFFLALNVLVSLLYSGRRDWWVKCLISLCLVYALWPGMEVFFWHTGNAGYLQPAVLTLLCLVAYRSEAALLRLCRRPLYLTGMTVTAFLAGYSFENVAPAVMLYMAISWWLMPCRWHRWPALIPLSAMTLGWLVLMLMPSTALRRHYYAQAFGIDDPGFGYYLGRAWEVAHIFFKTGGVLFAAGTLSLLVLIGMARKGRYVLSPRAWLTCLPAVLIVGSVSLAPYTEPRAFSVAWILMLAPVVELMHLLWHQTRWGRSAMVAVMLVSLLTALETARIYDKAAHVFNARETRILQARNTPACSSGLDIHRHELDVGYRYFNNRDVWYLNALPQISGHYGCSLVPASPDMNQG